MRHLLSSAWLITFDTVSFNSLFVKHKLCFSLSKYQPAGIGVPAAVFPAFPGTFALHPQVLGSLFREETVLIDRDAGRHTPHLIQHALFLRAIQRADTAVLLHGNELELFNRSVAAVESDPENAGISCAGTEEVVAEAVEYGYTVYILNILQNVRVGSDDQVCARIDKRLCLFDLPVFRRRHEFRSPVNKDDAEIRLFLCLPDFLTEAVHVQAAEYAGTIFGRASCLRVLVPLDLRRVEDRRCHAVGNAVRSLLRVFQVAARTNVRDLLFIQRVKGVLHAVRAEVIDVIVGIADPLSV